MYLWKCWRDTRLTVFVSFVVVLAFLLFLVAAIHSHRGQKQINELLSAALVIPSILLWFVGWILSKDSVGADIGKGSGDFLLTRPISRGHLIWTGWTVGITEGIVLWIVLSAAMYGTVFFKLRLLGIPVPHVLQPSVFPGFWLPPVFAIFLLNFGLIYGLAYCIGVIGRSGSRALIGSGIAVFAYTVLKSVLGNFWGIHLPDFFLNLHSYNYGIEIPSMLAFVVHGCLLVVFPAVAHFALEWMEV